jgi:hypothetical protein
MTPPSARFLPRLGAILPGPSSRESHADRVNVGVRGLPLAELAQPGVELGVRLTERLEDELGVVGL